MRRRHFERLRPICPLCRRARQAETPLLLAASLRETAGVIDEGVLQCPEPECLHEYPILDGIPLLVADLPAFVRANLAQLHARDDLSPTLESILGDCCGPGSAFDVTRQHLSIYARDHYGDLDPGEPDPDQARAAGAPPPGSSTALLETALDAAGEPPPGPLIDVGCAVGRTSFELAARFDRPVIGVDLSFAMLRLASRVLHRGEVRYPRRRGGLVYDRRSFAADLPARERVDFWLCDAVDLPFPAGTFALASHLNVLDCVAAPRDALASLARVLAPAGKAMIATPYDWSSAATPLEAWLGGHSQRGPAAGASEPVLRALLGGEHPAAIPGLRLLAERESLPWTVRLHDRSSNTYRVHLAVAEAAGERTGHGPSAGRES